MQRVTVIRQQKGALRVDSSHTSLKLRVICPARLSTFPLNLLYILSEEMFVPIMWPRTLRQPFSDDLDKSGGFTGEYKGTWKGQLSSSVIRIFIGQYSAALPAVCGSVWMSCQAQSSDVESAVKDVDEWLLWNIYSHPLNECFNPLKNVKGEKNIPFPTPHTQTNTHKHKVTSLQTLKPENILKFIEMSSFTRILMLDRNVFIN
jgi:hypothetical protein